MPIILDIYRALVIKNHPNKYLPYDLFFRTLILSLLYKDVFIQHVQLMHRHGRDIMAESEFKGRKCTRDLAEDILPGSPGRTGELPLFQLFGDIVQIGRGLWRFVHPGGEQTIRYRQHHRADKQADHAEGQQATDNAGQDQ